jgi:hypothetical protein
MIKSHFRGITIELDEKTHLEHLKGVRNITQEAIVLIIDFLKSVQEGRVEYKRGESTTISTEDIIKNPFKELVNPKL